MSRFMRWAAQQKIPRPFPSPCLVFRPARRLRCTAAHTVDLTEESLVDLAAALQESPALARTIASTLEPASRASLARAWAACKEEPAAPPRSDQLRQLALISALPMVGFGFMDNFIMLLAGDFIDASLGFKLGLTTMCAAGLGNIFSDVVGLAAAGPIELALKRLGVRGHNLTPAHLQLWSVVTVKYAGSAAGMVLGCLLGMVPLLFPEEHRLWASRSTLEHNEHNKSGDTHAGTEQSVE